jgi:NitT/TauT family transport system permease protein
MKERIPFSWRPLLPFAAVLLVWELAGHMAQLRPDRLPTPSRILFEAWRAGPYLSEHLAATAFAILGGLAAAVAASSLALALCVATPQSYPALRNIADSWKKFPVIAVAPVLVHWLGYGGRPRVLLVALTTFPVIVSGLLRGLAQVPEEMLELMTLNGATPGQITLKLRIPFLMPRALGSLKSAAALGVAACIAGEYVQAEAGLGFLMLSALSTMNTPLLFAGVCAAGLLAGVLVLLVAAAERGLTPWSER